MKKSKYITKFLIATSIIATICTPVATHADEVNNSINISDSISLSENQQDVKVSDLLTYDQLIKEVMRNENLSESQARKFIGPTGISRARGQFYRTYATVVRVTDIYAPAITFYCKTSEWDNYRGILSVIKASLDRRSSGMSKQFQGELYTNLESANTIYYELNGDFYHNGTTQVSLGGEIGVGQSSIGKFTASANYASNHYAYCYKTGRFNLNR